MRYALVFAASSLPSFYAGWVTRDLFDRHPLGDRMKRRTTSVLEWVATGHRWLIPYFLVLTIALLALAYTFVQDQDSEARDLENLACVATYLTEREDAASARTNANAAASDARRDFDAAESGPTKDALLVEYLRLYDIYVEVREGNPYPELTAQFCESQR